MSHVDEGTLHALLDGELSADERRAVEAHLHRCDACRAAMAEARELRGETESFIELLDQPDGRQVATPAPSRRGRRFQRMRTMGLAASVLIAVGAGYVIYTSGVTPRVGPTRPSAQETARSDASPDSGAAESAPRRAVPPPTQAPPVAARPEEATGRDRAAGAPAAPRPAPVDALGAAARNEQPAAQAEEREAFRDVANDAVDERIEPAAKTTRERQAGVSLDVAVQALGGAIRLIDGMTPVRVDTLDAEAARREALASGMVRITYQDSLDRSVILEEVRLPGERDQVKERADRAAQAQAPNLAANAGSVLARLRVAPGDTVISQRPDGTTEVRWVDSTGFLLTLIGHDQDYLLALIPRIR